MGYDDLIEAISGATGINTETVRTILDKMVDITIDALQQIESVHIGDLCIFQVKCTKRRGGRDPHTGRPIVYISRRYVKFYPSHRLREAIYKRYSPGTTEDMVWCDCHHC